MITNTDLQKMVKAFTAFFATKQDISDVKHDISDLKQDISYVKQDISDVKQDIVDLKDADQTILKEIFASKEELKNLEKRFDKKFDRVLNLVDAVLGEVKTMRIEQAAHLSSHDRIDKRLTSIESIPLIVQHLKN